MEACEEKARLDKEAHVIKLTKLKTAEAEQKEQECLEAEAKVVELVEKQRKKALNKRALELLREQKSKEVVETVESDRAGKKDEGEDVDTEEVSKGLREKALMWLKEKHKGKWKAVERKKRKRVVKSTLVVESEGSGEDWPGPKVVDLLTKLVCKVDGLAEAVDKMKKEMADLWGHVDDLISDFHMDDINSLVDLLDSDDEAWKASCIELHDLYSVNSEVLQKVMQWRLDEDMVHL
ncbi:hypothetical protein F5146DRAFT_1007335 [Armillaria mellea]|nr:hypothetical protein F5146DRAFT_1007335 [Armillaria mellea]